MERTQSKIHKVNIRGEGQLPSDGEAVEGRKKRWRDE